MRASREGSPAPENAVRASASGEGVRRWRDRPDRRATGEVSRYPATTLVKLADPDPVDGLACMRDRAPMGASDRSSLARLHVNRVRLLGFPIPVRHAPPIPSRDAAVIADGRHLNF